MFCDNLSLATAALAFESLGSPETFAKGVSHILKNDSKLARVINEYGRIKFQPQGEIFESLVESILSQQLATPAANAIIKKVRALYKKGILSPETLYSTPVGKLRSAGVSPQKIRYLKDLSKRVVKGKLDLESLVELSDEKLVKALDEVLGIGPWTVHMLLIFTLGRTDILPVDDLGIRKGIQSVYSLLELPKREKIEELAKNWHPYCSVASLYLWRFKDSAAIKNKVNNNNQRLN
jgi:DNA-3-methyladenine glycosylase II